MGASSSVDRSVHLRRVPRVVYAGYLGPVYQHRMGWSYVYQYFHKVREPVGVARPLKYVPRHPFGRGLLVLVERANAVRKHSQGSYVLTDKLFGKFRFRFAHMNAWYRRGATHSTAGITEAGLNGWGEPIYVGMETK